MKSLENPKVVSDLNSLKDHSSKINIHIQFLKKELLVKTILNGFVELFDALGSIDEL